VERLGPSGFFVCGGDAAPLPHAPSALFSVPLLSTPDLGGDSAAHFLPLVRVNRMLMARDRWRTSFADWPHSGCRFARLIGYAGGMRARYHERQPKQIADCESDDSLACQSICGPEEQATEHYCY